MRCYFFIQTKHGNKEFSEKFDKFSYIYKNRTVYSMYKKGKTHNYYILPIVCKNKK